MNLVVKVRKAVSDVLGVPFETITEETTSDHVENWNSFNTINLLMVLESEFGVSLSPQDAKDMVSVKLIVELLKERGATA